LPAEPARPAASPIPEGEWCVQLGAANDRGESEKLAAKFERFEPRIEVAEVQGKTWYRVRVGAFATKGAAEKYLKDLARETGAKGFVTTMH
jgi:cell division protein FtsN